MWLLLLSLVLCACNLEAKIVEGPPHDKVVVCYVATWSVYRPKPGSFEQEHLDPSLCTHLVYSFAGLDEHNYSIVSLDAWQDLEKDYGRNGYRRMVDLKNRYPHLKVTIAIGGWNQGSLRFSMMAENKEKREKFIKSVMQFLEMYKFDGLDLDWEYPAKRDGRPQDKTNFVALVKELKEAFESKGYILTAAFGAGKETMETAYELAKLSRHLNFIHMMCYDYHGSWDLAVGSNAPLRGQTDDDVLSVEFTIKYMLEHGVSPYKMVLGLPMYGRSFVLKNPDEKEIVFGKTEAQSQGFKGPWTKEAGFLGYNEICMELTNTSSQWVEHWDEKSATPYLRDGNRIITYDNARSIALKVKLAMDYNLGGVMVWSIDTDDFHGLCRPETDAYIDFEERFRKINEDPIMEIVIEKMVSNEGHQREFLNRRTAYIVDNGRLNFRLPEQQFTNYTLMRTINEATAMALEEKKIMEEIEKANNVNEIEDTPQRKVKKAASGLRINPWEVIVGLLVVSVRY